MIDGTEKPKIPSKFANTNTTNFAVNRNDKRFFLPCEKNAVDNLFVKDISFVVSKKLGIKIFSIDTDICFVAMVSVHDVKRV